MAMPFGRGSAGSPHWLTTPLVQDESTSGQVAVPSSRTQVVQVRRPKTERQRRVLNGLGLRGIGQFRYVDMNQPAIRGMIRHAQHLVDVREGKQIPQIERALGSIADLSDIDTRQREMWFSSGQHLTISSDSDTWAVAWTTEYSLFRVMRDSLHLLPATPDDGTAGDVWWSGGGEEKVDSVNQALRCVRHSWRNVAFLRLDYPSFSFTWMSPKEEGGIYGEVGFISSSDSGDIGSTLRQLTRLLEVTATPSVVKAARAFPSLLVLAPAKESHSHLLSRSRGMRR